MKLNNIGKQLKLMPQRLFAIILFLLIWEIASRIEVIDPVFIPPPSVVFSAFGKLILSGELQRHTIVSLQRSFTGFGAAMVIGIPLGFAVGLFKTVDKYLDPLLQAFRQIPTLALYPVLILLFGIGEFSKIVIIAKVSLWVILLNTINGVREVDPVLIKSARSMGVSQFDMFIKIILPSASPSVFTGMRLAATSSLLVLVAAEMIGANSGLGYLIYAFEMTYKIPEMYAAIVAISLLGLILNYTLVYLETRATKWKERAVIV